jgi:hypothetical protein
MSGQLPAAQQAPAAPVEQAQPAATDAATEKAD